MDEISLLNRVLKAKDEFGPKCGKYLGAVAIELIRAALKEHDCPVSQSDCFIKGIPVEIDLLIPRQSTTPENGILDQPQDVLIALEIKAHGAYGEKAASSIRRNFLAIQEKNESIRCFYITLMERKGYKWAITDSSLAFPEYTLFLYSGKRESHEPTGDWQGLLSDIKSICSESGRR